MLREKVFINCPFDSDYNKYFQAIVFTIHFCGFESYCALEKSDSSDPRIEKIVKFMKTCRLSIHDISYVKLDPDTGLPRFNMPFELGLFIGAKKLGIPKQRNKECLIIDIERYRFQIFLSDIAGQDIESYDSDVMKLIKVIRNWLKEKTKLPLPGYKKICNDYSLFLEYLLETSEELGHDLDDLPYNDLKEITIQWFKMKA